MKKKLKDNNIYFELNKKDIADFSLYIASVRILTKKALTTDFDFDTFLCGYLVYKEMITPKEALKNNMILLKMNDIKSSVFDSTNKIIERLKNEE